MTTTRASIWSGLAIGLFMFIAGTFVRDESVTFRLAFAVLIGVVAGGVVGFVRRERPKLPYWKAGKARKR